MWLQIVSMKHPVTVFVTVISIMLVAIFGLSSMKEDIFPDLNLPVIYVVQGFGGMAPDQMEGYIVSTYEVHFLYIPGIDHIESQSIQNVSMMKIFFHPGTNMAEALSTCVAMVSRARSLMPPGIIEPFVLRFDAGSLPVGQLVLESKEASIDRLQDLAYVRVRPDLGTIPGATAPPPFGGNVRTIVINVNAQRLRQFNISGDMIVKALATGNAVIPAGNVRIGDYMQITPINTDLPDIHQLDYLPVKMGPGPTVFLRDIATITDSSDILAGYALYNGRRTVYVPLIKRADASTVSVVDALKAHLPAMQKLLPENVHIGYHFDQSKHVTNSINGLLFEGALGAILPGVMILLFLRDLRSTMIVVTTIPCVLLGACLSLYLTGQTINIQTLSGLSLAIGILVDEATVDIENIHSHLARGEPITRATLMAGIETRVPRLLAMMSIIAVFVPSFFMTGIVRSLFVPLSLAVGFCMVWSFFMSSSLVPVMSVYLIKQQKEEEDEGLFGKFRSLHEKVVKTLMKIPYIVIPVYFIFFTALSVSLFPLIGREMFPNSDTDEFRVRIRCATGTRVEVTEKKVLQVLDVIKREAGPDNVQATLGYAGQQPVQFVLNSVFLWTSGPHEAVMDVKLREEAKIDLLSFKDHLRDVFSKEMPDIKFSFEPGDLVSQIMNFGSNTPISIQIKGPDLDVCRDYAEKVKFEMSKIKYLRDLMYGQPLNYPTVDINIDRELAGQFNLTPKQVGDSLVPATSSSRYILENFWMDRKTGVAYQVQVQVPQDQIQSVEALKNFPTMLSERTSHPLLRDIADVHPGKCVGEYDRDNMMRLVSVTANISGMDLGTVGDDVEAALRRAGEPPRSVRVKVAGQVPVLHETFSHLFTGLGLAVGVIFLMLTGYFQSLRMAAIVLSTLPAIISGVLLSLFITHTTINVESFMGAIMSIGVGVSNAILLVVFAEKSRLEGKSSLEAALHGAQERLRPILMTSSAMVAGMIPMALALSEGGQTSAPLGRAVIGGLLMSTLSALTVLPLVFSVMQKNSSTTSPSVHPDDRGE
ncbi:MAG TPA: efflux RND transporter permease subunit [Oculatellaceae cyanobacterium]